MKRIFPDFAYGAGPRQSCWWDETCAATDRPPLKGKRKVDVAIIGAGFTGISAAYALAKEGVDVAVLDMHSLGWGASGRNGGFCCLGGSKADDDFLDTKFGKSGRLAYRATEKAAVDLVDSLIASLGLDVDRHSSGETELAHRPRDMARLEARIEQVMENHGVEARITRKKDLLAEGFGGPFHGALTIPVGFALNPCKYIFGLAQAAEVRGATIFHQTPVERVEKTGTDFVLSTPSGSIQAENVIVATNGYTSEDVPDWLASRYLPAQSTVLVTRPVDLPEREAQGWTSEQMSFDSRNLLHYFRLMPDGRFLFGMRGGFRSGPSAEARARARLRRDFEEMFPAWRAVASEHSWSGLVCLARNRLPFVGLVPGHPGLFAGLCYHGNGVAMGTLSGHLLAQLVLGRRPEFYPEAISRPLDRFPMGRSRRLLMLPLYATLMLRDL
jgi:glycine/D-amino acid oxidase-like deaminating enzyme